jgi:cell division protein ZapA
MAQVSVSINGKTFRMACEDGQEQHLTGLAEGLNKTIERLKGDFGEIGDQRLIVMAAITMADQCHEAQRRVRQLEGELAGVIGERDALAERGGRFEAETVAAVDAAAEQIEQAAGRLANGGEST